MKIFRYLDPRGTTCYGCFGQDGVPSLIIGDPLGEYHVSSETPQISKYLPPIMPSVIIAIGLNYRQHAEEQGAKIPEHPVVFFKNPASVCGAEDPIVLPRRLRSDKVDYECELAVVIGMECKNASREDALSYVLGYTCANDVSARDWQKEWGGGQWSRSKSFDSFCPLGPFIATPDVVPDPNALNIRTILNGQAVQEANTSDMIFDVRTLIQFLSAGTTLLPGTVILTGTPSGVGMARIPPVWLKPGDTVTVEIDGIGTLTNPVVEEAQ